MLDSKDRIGIRAGYEGNRGWAREEFFYVEEEGRLIGDIAWEFRDLTSVRAIPCNENYLVIEGGGFRLSGDTPEGDASGYYQNGMIVERSRTIIREQWMGLEPGKRDVSLEPRSGFYRLNSVYDVTLENIRAMPWEKSRRPPETAVQHGTYGIGGARMLNCTFRNLTAEGGWVSWGVFGTNLNKNFRLEHCRLNRVDVHFHCWNLTIADCTIGFKGLAGCAASVFFQRCTVHAPVVGGKPEPETIGQTGILEINGAVRHYHLNTALGNDLLHDLRTRGVELTAQFIAKLKCHHALEG